ncbi:hypothetical protein GDO81_025230 [Engystomops pustulosus]|uniref:Uncharacterized protein n=1 Tax=Engystomops pustulosus TaxID=76066 RepID=A0AAV6YIQ7_ENGPU|nr:hypothetical protein GDO81_025230 [Engystomops pustulosus]
MLSYSVECSYNNDIPLVGQRQRSASISCTSLQVTAQETVTAPARCCSPLTHRHIVRSRLLSLLEAVITSFCYTNSKTVTF